MTIRMVDAGWGEEFADALSADKSELKIICPFIKAGAISRLLSNRPKSIQVVTRFNLCDFAEGVSDTRALRNLIEQGAGIRGIRNLHAKLYLFGACRAIVTSANLTEAAINRNHEFGLVADDEAVIAACRTYFNALWLRGGSDVTIEQIDGWDEIVTRYRTSGGRPINGADLGDFGVDVGIGQPPPIALPAVFADTRQAFVKFLGEGNNRVPLTFSIFEEINRAGCHWAVAYPESKRPMSVQDDALIFIARLTQAPNDMRIFGRAIGMKYVTGRDDATAEDTILRPWKATWPRYIRVHHGEFVAGSMANGISLNALMDALGSNAFLPTQRNAANGGGNTDPRRAYRQQPAVELSPEGLSWLSDRLQYAFDAHGKVPTDALDHLDWPVIP